jgi:hypothetical protein
MKGPGTESIENCCNRLPRGSWQQYSRRLESGGWAPFITDGYGKTIPLSPKGGVGKLMLAVY